MMRCLQAGADLKAQGGVLSETPLHMATRFGTTEVVTALLEVGADPNAQALFNYTPLHSAQTGEAITALLRAGAELEARNEFGHTPLHSAQTGEAINTLLEAGANLNAQDERGDTPLHSADVEAITALLGAGAELEARNEFGQTPLHMRALFGAAESVGDTAVGGGEPCGTRRKRQHPAALCKDS